MTASTGLPADEVISTLQKSIRRGDVRNAVLCALDLSATSQRADTYLWDRLHVIAVEDVGFGDRRRSPWSLLWMPLAALRRSHEQLVVHAVRVLAESAKDRSNDELANVIRAELDGGDVRTFPTTHSTCTLGAGQQARAASSTS